MYQNVVKCSSQTAFLLVVKMSSSLLLMSSNGKKKYKQCSESH